VKPFFPLISNIPTKYVDNIDDVMSKSNREGKKEKEIKKSKPNRPSWRRYGIPDTHPSAVPWNASLNSEPPLIT
jgi:hypothetical protein